MQQQVLVCAQRTGESEILRFQTGLGVGVSLWTRFVAVGVPVYGAARRLALLLRDVEDAVQLAREHDEIRALVRPFAVPEGLAVPAADAGG